MVFFNCTGYLLLAQSRNVTLWSTSVMFTAKLMASVVAQWENPCLGCARRGWILQHCKKPTKSKQTSKADGRGWAQLIEHLPSMYEVLGYIPSVTSWGWSVPALRRERHKDQKFKVILSCWEDPGQPELLKTSSQLTSPPTSQNNDNNTKQNLSG